MAFENETTTSIGSFFADVAGHPTLFRGAARANEEMAELLTALAEGDHPQALVEAADVVIVLAHMAHVNGYDLWDIVEQKMKKNRGRQWQKDGTGCAYHMRGAPSIEHEKQEKN